MIKVTNSINMNILLTQQNSHGVTASQGKKNNPSETEMSSEHSTNL